MLEDSPSPRLFAKDPGYTICADQFKFLPSGFQHAFLIRHPLRVMQSRRKGMISHLSQNGMLHVDEENFDIERDDPLMISGSVCRSTHALWKFVRANIDPHPIIIDGDELMTKPHELLPKFCRAVGIPYNDSLLEWDNSNEITKSWNFASSSDGFQTSFQSFFERAANSTKFHPPSEMIPPEKLTPDVIKCANDVMPHYREMYASRLSI